MFRTIQSCSEYFQCFPNFFKCSEQFKKKRNFPNLFQTIYFLLLFRTNGFCSEQMVFVPNFCSSRVASFCHHCLSQCPSALVISVFDCLMGCRFVFHGALVSQWWSATEIRRLQQVHQFWLPCWPLSVLLLFLLLWGFVFRCLIIGAVFLSWVEGCLLVDDSAFLFGVDWVPPSVLGACHFFLVLLVDWLLLPLPSFSIVGCRILFFSSFWVGCWIYFGKFVLKFYFYCLLLLLIATFGDFISPWLFVFSYSISSMFIPELP